MQPDGSMVALPAICEVNPQDLCIQELKWSYLPTKNIFSYSCPTPDILPNKITIYSFPYIFSFVVTRTVCATTSIICVTFVCCN